MLLEIEVGDKEFLEKRNKESTLWRNSMLKYTTGLGSNNEESEAIIDNAIKESLDRHVKSVEDFGPYEKSSEVFEKVIFPKLRDCYKPIEKRE
mgnify:CR=1 FL=1